MNTPEIVAKFAAVTRLAHGGHRPPTDAESVEMCAMEAVAYVMGEPWSDTPQCVSPVIAAACRSWNDGLPASERTALLLPLLPLTVGTRTTAADERTRAAMAGDWLVRVHTPAWLRLAGLTADAQALESLARIIDTETLMAAQAALTAAQRNAAESWETARETARAAAWDAAWAAAWDAARAAAWDAAWAAAWAAAWDAAWAAAATETTCAAARAKADAALADTRRTLQASFADVLRAMCAVGRAETPEAGGNDAPRPYLTEAETAAWLGEPTHHRYVDETPEAGR
jgi:hypothetical protein